MHTIGLVDLHLAQFPHLNRPRVIEIMVQRFHESGMQLIEPVKSLTEDDGVLNYLAAASHPLPDRRRKFIYGSVDYFPRHPSGFDAIDAIVFDGGSLAGITPAQIDAIQGFLHHQHRSANLFGRHALRAALPAPTTITSYSSAKGHLPIKDQQPKSHFAGLYHNGWQANSQGTTRTVGVCQPILFPCRSGPGILRYTVNRPFME